MVERNLVAIPSEPPSLARPTRRAAAAERGERAILLVVLPAQSN
jgi:hypothetical protein